MTAYPPGPRDEFVFSRLRKMSRDPLGFFAGVAAHGDVAHFRIGLQHVYMLSDPEAIKELLVTKAKSFMKDRGLEATKTLLGEGLLTSEGEFHKRQRRLAQPAFHHARVGAYGATMIEHALRAQSRWQPGQTLDVMPEMLQLALGIVGKTLFDTDVEKDSREVGEALNVAMEMFTMGRIPFSHLLDALPLPSTRRFHRARDRLDAIVYRFIREHRASGQDRGDLLSMLLLAQDDEHGTGSMSDEQLRDEAMTIFLAGHETTAGALSWTFYALSQNPAVEARLHRELDEVLGDAPPRSEDVRRLRYTEQVLSEAMRLYPPAWAVGRRAAEDVEIAGVRIAAKSAIVASQWVVHRDPRLWPDPLRFDPGRFTPEAKAARHKFAYFPFGGGPRVCIGDGFAWMAGTLLLATLAQRWRFRLVPGHVVEPLPRVTLRMKHGLRMTLEPRARAAAA